MAQRFLSIKNFEKYQHFKKANPPWVKLYKSLFTDRAFMLLPIPCKYLFIGLISLASEGANRVANDPSWIAHRLAISPSEIDLKPLYKSGFLIASESTARRYKVSLREETETETETETEEKRAHTVVNGQPVNGTRPEIPLPDEWTCKPHHERFAHARGLDLKIEEAHFRGKAIEKDWKTKDWDRKFSNWMLQEVKFRARRTG